MCSSLPVHAPHPPSQASIALRRRFLYKTNALAAAIMTEIPGHAVALIGDIRDRPLRAWRSKGFLACFYHAALDPTWWRLTVNRTMILDTGDWVDGITWDELMQVKQECGFGAWWGVEIYPPPEKVVDVANMRHLWLHETRPRIADECDLSVRGLPEEAKA